MFRQIARLASRVRFAEMSVTSQCSSNRNLGSALTAFPRDFAWARRVFSFATALVLAGSISASAQAPTLEEVGISYRRRRRLRRALPRASPMIPRTPSW